MIINKSFWVFQNILTWRIMNIDKIIRHTYARVRCQDRALMSCQKTFELTARKTTDAARAITTHENYQTV